MCLTISSNIKQEPFIIHKTDKFLTSFAVCICWIGRLNREVIFVVPCVEAFAQRTYISCTYAYIWIHLWIWTLRAFSRPQCKQRKACVYLLNSINLPSLVCVCDSMATTVKCVQLQRKDPQVCPIARTCKLSSAQWLLEWKICMLL